MKYLKDTQIQFHKTIANSAALYGSEMKVKRMDEKIIQISEMRFLTHIARQAL
jgi:hypothetical protein